MVDAGLLKEGSVLIDIGVCAANGGKGGIRGDLDAKKAKQRCRLIAKNPGGVGPINSAMIINNLVDAWIDQNGLFLG